MKIILSLIFLSAWASGQTVSREKLSQLHVLRAQIKKSVFEQSRYQQDILKSELDIEKQQQEIEKLSGEANTLKEKIESRIKNLYKIRRTYESGSLLSITSANDFLRKGYYLKYLNAQDKKVISEYKSHVQAVQKIKDKTAKYHKRLLFLKKKSEAQYASLMVKEKEQRDLIRQIRDLVKQQSEKGFFSELRGQLEFPSGNQILGNLGLDLDRRRQLTQLRTGVVMKADAGAEVRSVFDGEVVHVGSIAGWGPTIILDHGEFYYSVYSQIKNLSVRLGDRVLSQQKLADVSSVPYHKEGLYFEIRHYSEPEDPRQWFKGEQP